MNDSLSSRERLDAPVNMAFDSRRLARVADGRKAIPPYSRVSPLDGVDRSPFELAQGDVIQLNVAVRAADSQAPRSARLLLLCLLLEVLECISSINGRTLLSKHLSRPNAGCRNDKVEVNPGVHPLRTHLTPHPCQSSV